MLFRKHFLGPTVCETKGGRCDGAGGHVESLDLPDSSLLSCPCWKGGFHLQASLKPVSWNSLTIGRSVQLVEQRSFCNLPVRGSGPACCLKCSDRELNYNRRQLILLLTLVIKPFFFLIKSKWSCYFSLELIKFCQKQHPVISRAFFCLRVP